MERQTKTISTNEERIKLKTLWTNWAEMTKVGLTGQPDFNLPRCLQWTFIAGRCWHLDVACRSAESGNQPLNWFGSGFSDHHVWHQRYGQRYAFWCHRGGLKGGDNFYQNVVGLPFCVAVPNQIEFLTKHFVDRIFPKSLRTFASCMRFAIYKAVPMVHQGLLICWSLIFTSGRRTNASAGTACSTQIRLSTGAAFSSNDIFHCFTGV